MSWLRRPLNLGLRVFEKPFLSRMTDVGRLRRGFALKSRILLPAPRGLSVTQEQFAQQGRVIPALHVDKGRDPVILYLHGGAYVFGSSRTQLGMVGRLTRYAGCAAVLPDYRRAPEHPFPSALEDALAVYRSLLQRTPRIVIGGDSAGGGLALSLLGEIVRQGLPKPMGCFAFSPLTDLSFAGQSVLQNARCDVMLPATRAQDMAELYLQGADPLDPRASPLFADFGGAPPVFMTVGQEEILLDDTRRMAAHLCAQNVRVEVDLQPGLPHVWPFFHPVLPEARATLRQVAGWISSLSPKAGDS
jgi:monoterpene epsilon-lactone hydrolase